MRTGEGVLNQPLCALRLSNSSFELTKLCFREASPWLALAGSRRQERPDLSKCEPSVLAELNQRHALGAQGAIVLRPAARPAGESSPTRS
jgi:hypothetical protein